MKYFLLLALFLLTFGLGAQNLNFSFKGTVTNQDNGKSEAGVTVSIVQNGNTVSSATTATNGKYNLKGNVNYSQPFSVVFSKAGMVSKKVNFNFTLLNEEDIPPGSEYQPLTDLSMSIFADRPEVDFSFLKTEPVASFDWNQTKMVADLDRVASEKMKVRIEKLLGQSEQNSAANEAKYQALIKEADNLYLNQKQYESALAKYEEASLLKPKEPYPIQRIDELDALIKAQKEKELTEKQADSEYLNLIKAADLLRDQKKYDLAIAKYNEAIAKKDEQYPKDQIKLIEGLKKEAENEAKYQEAVKQADMFYNQKSYNAAKDKYILANQLKPNEPHPKNRLAEIEKKQNELNAAKEKKAKYDEAVAAADALFGEEKYAEAKEKYNEALTYESAATYPVERIKECDLKLADQQKEKDRLDKIAKLLQEGGVLFGQSKWLDAKAKYTEVLTLDAQNAEAKAKLDEIQKKQEELANQAAVDAKFQKLVSEGDLAVKGLKYPEAKAKYEEALGLKQDAAVQAKLDDVNKKIADVEAKAKEEERFLALKAEGIKLAGEEKWLDAKSKLVEAQTIKTDPQITQKLKEIEDKIKANEALLQLEKDYNDLISAAQAKEAAKDLDGAIAKYKEASLKKPAEQMPKDKIKELEALKLAGSKQKEIDAQYAALMKKGKELMDGQKFLDAIKEFNAANILKPEEEEPVRLAAECERLEKEKGNEENEKIEKIFTVAKTKFDEKDYVKAKELAERYLSFRPDDQRAKDLIQLIQEREAAEKNYVQKMKEAELQASAKNYEKAIGLFEQAKVFKPEEPLPQKRIDELNKLILDQANSAQKEQLYKDYMTKGSISMNTEQYEQALIHYQNALSVKENDQAAKDKIAEVQQILDNRANAEKNALDRKNRFDALIKEGDDRFTAENYSDAIKSYEAALLLDATSSYAKTQIDESRKRIALKNADLAEQEYQNILKEGDDQFNMKSYDKARLTYEKALSIRSNDPYPKKKLEEIDAILNPVVVQMEKLEPLGDPYDNSIIDGYAALVKADVERKNVKSTKMKDQVDEIQNDAAELTDVKTAEQQRTTNEIYQVQSMISIADEGRDLNRQETVSTLDAVEEAQSEDIRLSEEYKQSDILSSADKLTQAVNESSVDYTERESVYTDNTENLGNIRESYNEEMNVRSDSEAASNVSADQKLIVVENAIAREEEDNYDERKETEQAVDRIVINAADREEVMSSDRYETTLSNQNELNVVEEVISIKENDDAKQPGENKEELKLVESAVTTTEEVMTETRYEYSTDVNRKIEEVNISIAEADVVRDLNRQETAEELDNGRAGIADAEHVTYGREAEKYLKNKNEIQNQVDVNNGIDEKAEESHSINVNSIAIIDEKATMTDQTISLSDDEQRLRARSTVEIMNETALESGENSTKRQEANAEKMDDVTKTIDAEHTNQEEAQTEKHYDNQAKISSIESKQPVKVRVANSLGQDYPEGVTQESFTQSDENGLMTAIITRRIVVINGEGNVYVRTQTLSAITYTKNGQPTTEYVWQKETQGPHLEKHY